MTAARQFAACLVLVGLLFVVAIGVVSPAQGGAGEQETTTTTAAVTTTAAPATTAAPTTTAPAATSTTVRATTTTAPRTTTTSNTAGTPAPATTSLPPDPDAATPVAAVTGAVVDGTEQTETTVRQPIRPNVPSLPRSSTGSAEATGREPTGTARRAAAPLEPENDVGVQPNLAPLFEEEAPIAVAGQKSERGRLSNKPLAVAGVAVGAVVGLLLGLADRAAGLAVR